MKKTILSMCVAGMAVIGFSSMREVAPPTISGKVTPAEGAEAVLAIKDADTVRTTVGTDGAFQLEVKPGTWKLVVSAKEPYKNAEVSSLEATDDKNTDAGEIKLDK